MQFCVFFFFYSRAAVSVVFSTLLSCSGFIMCSLYASCIFIWTNKDDDDDELVLWTCTFCAKMSWLWFYFRQTQRCIVNLQLTSSQWRHHGGGNPFQTRFSDSCKSDEKFEGMGDGVNDKWYKPGLMSTDEVAYASVVDGSLSWLSSITFMA